MSVPAGVDVYLPDLQDCFAGQETVGSWTDTLTEVVRHNIDSASQWSLLFLTTPAAERILSVPKLLSQPVPTLPKPSAQSKADFESRTAAINVTPSPGASYNIDEIKEDTLWLSKILDVDEVECLRVAALEWQTRPAAQLQQGLSETETASLRDALGSEGNSYGLGRGDTPGPAKLADPAFHSREQRRTRLVALSMQEQSNMYRVSAVLTDMVVQLDLMTTSGVELHAQTFGGQLRAVVQGSLTSVKANHAGTSLSSCLDAMKIVLEQFTPSWAGESFVSNDLQDKWKCARLYQISSLMELVLLHHQSLGAYAQSSHVLAWLRLMSELKFFLVFEPQSTQQTTLSFRIKDLATTCTLALLYLGHASEYIERVKDSPEMQLDRTEALPYFMDPHVAAEIHQLMLHFASTHVAEAAPAVLAWGLILGNTQEVANASKEWREASQVQKAIESGSYDSASGRRLSSSSVGSIQQSPAEDVMDSVRSVSLGEDDIDHLTRSAIVDCEVFAYIAFICTSDVARSPIGITVQAETYQQLIITAVAQTSYTADIVAAQLALIEALADVSKDFQHTEEIHRMKTRRFRKESGVRDVMDVAASRFPYEPLPFLQLCNSLAKLDRADEGSSDSITTILRNLTTFTQVTNPSFSAYRTTREHENANLVTLDAHLGMLDSAETQRMLDFEGQATALKNIIPSGTIGEVITEKRPLVIKWYHSYSCFAFLGLWLDGFRCGELQSISPDQDDREAMATTILDLFSTLLSDTRCNRLAGLENAYTLLDEIASGLPDDVDLLSMVFDICEQQLQSLRYRKQNLRSCDTVTACLKLIKALLPLLPSRVWSSLSRSTLIEARGTGGGVLALVLSIESTKGGHDFLEAHAELYQALTNDAMRQAIGPENTPGLNRAISHNVTVNGGVPKRVVNSVVYASTQILLSAFRSGPLRKVSASPQSIRISKLLSEAFLSVLQCVFGADDSPDLSTKLTASLAASATYIVEFLRPPLEGTSEAVCLIRWLLVSWQESSGSSTLRRSGSIAGQIRAIADLTATVLCVGTASGLPQSALEAQLLDFLPVLVRLGTFDRSCLFEVLDVTQALLGTMSPDNAPPLFARLGSASAKSFLDCILPLVRQPKHDKVPFPAERSRLGIKVWEFLTTLIKHNQQWFAIVLLKGSPPDFAARDPKANRAAKQHASLRGKSILAEALDQFTAIKRLDLVLAAAILKFIVSSQMHWNWVSDGIEAHATLLPSLITYVSDMRLEDNNQLVQCRSNKVATHVVELATIQLHYARSRRDKAMIQKMMPLIRWLTSNAVKVGGYNVSLHSSLSKNFSARYESCTLANFKRTQLFEQPYGDGFYYDLALARKMLSHRNLQSRRPDFDRTFLPELIRVNTNLSLVDSQMVLLETFQIFCVEHCTFFSQDAGVQKMMANVVQNLLTANTIPPPSELIFETLFQTRAEFALVLIRRLAEIRSRGSEFSGLLSAAWNAIRFRNVSYEYAIDNDDLVYFRTTLTILFLAMQFHTDKRHEGQDRLALVATQRDPTSSTVLEIASVIVADGLNSAVSTVHEQASHSNAGQVLSETSQVDTSDISLILMIFKSILRLHILPQVISQLSSGFVSSSIVKSCLLLYSWSHTLGTPGTGNELVYADLSLRFLVSLSSLPQVAEELAVEGVLARMSTARVTQLLQSAKGGVSQSDKRPFIAALYRVWTTGILPLCLNLLHSVGRAMAGEVAAFLNQFPHQLARASKAFSYPSAAGEPLTLALANEGAVLALISRVLSNYRVAGASAGVDAYEIPALEGYDDQKAAIVEDVKEIIAGGKLQVRAAPASEKEAAWQKMNEGKGGNKLEKAILAELTNVLTCLGDDGQM